MSDELGRWLRYSVSAVEDVVDVRWRQLERRFGWDGIPRIQPYLGFANDEFAWFHGRVLTNPPRDLPSEDDRWWDNVAQMYRRFGSDEVPDVTIELDFAGKRHRTITDDEGYFHLETANTRDVRDHVSWKKISMRIVDHHRVDPDDSITVSRMLTPPLHARFGVISDVDDTVLHTGSTGLLTAARLTFLHNARTRKPLPGVGAFYRALHRGTAGVSSSEGNPLFYVSSSPWNLFDLLEDFMSLNDIPEGPILLRDLGFDRNKFLKEGHEHKLDKVQRILTAYPNLPFVLSGDSGQADAELYAEAARRFPDRIRAIFIRDVDPEAEHDFDTVFAEPLKRTKSVNVPMYIVTDSFEAAEHAVELGLIDEALLPMVRTETTRDLQRPTLV